MTTLPVAHLSRLALVAAFVATSFAAHAQTVATAKPTATQPAKKAVTKPKAKAAAPAAAPEVLDPVSDAQLQVASRVLTGTAQCEFNQTVSVTPVQDKPGYFTVGFNKASYTMAPQETTTGAVRLEDKKNGIVWLQIPAKSMMMNHKVGQRMVDGCTLAEQRAFADAVAAAPR